MSRLPNRIPFTVNSDSVPSHPADGRDERGSALVIALVFLVLASVLVGALVAQGTPSIVTTDVVKNLNDSVAAADAGVEYGIQTLRNDSTICPDPSSAQTTLPDIAQVNNNVVHVSCQTLQGYAAGGLGWAVITHDKGGSSIEGGNDPMSITGGVFNAGGWKVGNKMAISDGNVHTATCPLPKNVTVAPTPPFSSQCGINPPPDPAPFLPTAVPGTASPPDVTSGCTTLYPGHYTTSNPPPLSGKVYMASGVYFFDNLGKLVVSGTLFGGQPAPGDLKLTAAIPCATDPIGYGTDGKGVEIILGGDTSISVAAGSTMELYTRTPASDDGSTPGVTLYQTAQAPWTTTSLPAPTNFFLAVGNDAQVAVHGEVYGPSGSVSLSGSGPSPVLTGSADVFDLEIPSSPEGPIISVGATPGERHIIVTSTAVGAGGATNIVARAVVEIGNDVNRTVTIDSWRTRHDCPDAVVPCSST